jgi:hypothetical protein
LLSYPQYACRKEPRCQVDAPIPLVSDFAGRSRPAGIRGAFMFGPRRIGDGALLDLNLGLYLGLLSIGSRHTASHRDINAS